MAVLRDNPYGASQFLVDFGTSDPQSIDAGFAEVTGLGMSVDIIEYRAGNDKEPTIRKLPGLTKTTNVSLKRGVIGSNTLFQWLKETSQGNDQPRTVTITLLNEKREPVIIWKLLRARPAKYTGPTLQAKGSDLAMEELVLSYERLEVE